VIKLHTYHNWKEGLAGVELSDLWGTLSKMKVDHSWFVGAVASIPMMIPGWVQHEEWEIHHNELILVLALIILMDWVAGSRLAHRAGHKQSTHWNDSLIRDVMILGMCVAASLLDDAMHTGSFLFFVITMAFVHHNLYSLLANLALLGWDKYFPVGLLRWLNDELVAKAHKYFGGDYSNDDKNKKH
jgi:phage-related holin